MRVYKTTNLLNGKFYVGKQASNSEYYLGSGKALKSAIEKYGRNNFKKEILEVCSSLEELSNREIYWIKELNAVERGYNIAEGGTGGRTFGGGVKKGNIPWNKGLKGKQIAWNKGTKGVMKANKTTFKPGKEHPQYGKKQSQETINKRLENSPQKKAVLDNTTGIVYSSIGETAKATGLSRGTIHNHVSGKVKLNRFLYAKKDLPRK